MYFQIHSDFNVKVVTVADGSQKMLKGHTAPVLSVTIDPKDQYIVSKLKLQKKPWLNK